jgi:two-component system chemotaxis response regulator CheB
LPEPIRVLVAEDSPTVRRRLVAVLSSVPGMTVVGEARDGRQAIESCHTLKPDVITMDMMMPVMSGLAATEYIMAFCPTPIVIVSGSTNRGELFRTYEALSAGALDVVEKPHGDETDDAWERQLIETVRIASRVRVITHPRARLRPEGTRPPQAGAPRPDNGHTVIGIGASTGGPKAIVEILQALPPAFPAPLLIVTHISAAFSPGFAEWLANNSPIPVCEATHNMPLPARGVIVAPADRHLVLQGSRLLLTATPERQSCRPSVDELFESLARESGHHGIGVLLTGMGRDGAQGLLRMRQAGAVTIAQDEPSSVIFGMPAEAIRLGAAQHVLPPPLIAEMLRALAPAGTATEP